MSDRPAPGVPGDDRPDIFTLLSIAMCPQDDGTRPVNLAWVGSDIGYMSPAIAFAQFPVLPGQPTQVAITIRNNGTADSCGVLLETACNVYIGNQANTMVPVQNSTIPLIPAGGSYTASVVWTPQNIWLAHACFHARAFDTYSTLHYPARCNSWDSYVNPQAGNHNTVIFQIPDPQANAVITFPVLNSTDADIRPKLLVTNVDQRARFADPAERFPLPFVPEQAEAPALTAVAAAAAVPGGIGYGRAAVAAHEHARWPRPEVDQRFVHGRFGFDMAGGLQIPRDLPAEARECFFVRQPLQGVDICSYRQFRLAPGRHDLLRLVIPPAEFPPPGRRRKFQIDYQVGDERPVQQFVFLYR